MPSDLTNQQKNRLLEQAVQMIADNDAALAQLFKDQPAARHNVVTCLHSLVSKGPATHLADRIAIVLRNTIELIND